MFQDEIEDAITCIRTILELKALITRKFGTIFLCAPMLLSGLMFYYCVCVGFQPTFSNARLEQISSSRYVCEKYQEK